MNSTKERTFTSISCAMFKRREGTAGISGHLFETKLLSLLYYRAIHDDRIIAFQLASNVDKMGAFDDICLKAEVEEFDKPVLVFIQAKHRENKKQTLKIDLATYFISYLKVRQHFDPSNKDLFFKGKFDETECLFVLYTTARDEFSNNLELKSSFSSILNDLIGTGGMAKQPYNIREHVEFLCKVAMKEQMTSLAERIAKFINDDGNFQVMLTDELVLRYHVILAQKAVVVSEIQPDGHRIATFCQDFFDINEEYLTIFKDTLIKQILKKRKIKPTDVKKNITEFVTKPTDASILSKLVGTVITYDNGQLAFDNKFINEIKQIYRSDLKAIDIPRATVNTAVDLAAKNMLLSPEFKLRVPAAFGNKDITLSGSDEKKKKRIKHLASKIIDLLDKCTSKIVIIDETLGDGFLQLNGGIAGAIGNIFVLDDDTKLMKMTNNVDSLGSLSKNLYERLNDEIELINEKKSNNKIYNLCDYKFCFNGNKFPKLSLECSENEEPVTDFLNKLVIYSNQADEEGVENILKSEIAENQLNEPNYFQVQTDAIFSKYHDEILKWWKQPEQAPLLTRESDLFQIAKKSIIKDPLLSIIAAMYQNKIKPVDYTFTEDAVNSLNLQNPHSNTVIVTENSRLTVVKVIQRLKNKDHVALDLNYIVRLPPNDRNALRRELKDVNEGKILILVCDKIQKEKIKIIENIAQAVLDKKTIVVTNHASIKILQKYFSNPAVHDEKNNLINMTEESQRRILEHARVIFQDTEARLDLIVDDKSKIYVKGDVLMKVISEDTITVGKLIINKDYKEIKHLHVDRRVRKSGDDVDILVKNLTNLPDDVVLITAEPGMGKSTLLTHLSIKTKELIPEVWILRINLLEYSREFSKWKEEETVITTLETLKFMCQVILRDNLGKENKVEITLEEKDNVVYLKHCTADPLVEFELNLFLHFYYERDMIFLFDGFDEICPQYTDVVMKCLKCVRNYSSKQRMWITSRSYNEIKSILLEEFELSYDILYFSKEEIIKYWETYWEINLGLKELNNSQHESVEKFIEYMAAMRNKRIPVSEPLFAVFQIAAFYLNFKITNQSDKKYETYFFSKQVCNANPLLLYLTALYVVDSIKKVKKKSRDWYIDVDTFNVYERFLEKKIKIRYEEKNEMNIHNPDIIKVYDKELADSILKHKKLGAYTIFNEFSLALFSAKDLEEIKEIIKDLEKGEEKMGLIDSVANGIPLFTHMTFTEYFAVEYVCDCLKTESNSGKLEYFYIMFTEKSFSPIRTIFDHKMKIDKTLMTVLKNNKGTIFNWIMSFSRLRGKDAPQFRAVVYSPIEGLNNLGSLFENTINYGIMNNQVTTFSDKVKLNYLISLRRYVERVVKHVFDESSTEEEG